MAPPVRRLFSRGSWPEAQHVARALRTETVGGVLLLVGTLVALTWANSPWREAYQSLRETTVGPAALKLDLTLSEWAGDGLLAVFFLVAGMELKRELVVGDLRDPAKAVLPVVAALAGVAVPALLLLAVTAGDPAAANATERVFLNGSRRRPGSAPEPLPRRRVTGLGLTARAAIADR